jgi:hypothetical protein
MKIENYKVINLIESYKFDVKSISIWQHTEKYIIFQIRQALVCDYCASEILYYFLNILTSSNEKTQN